ncbi:MAG: amidase, partial [Prosthecobacter sp.]|nr:amidase [Prosthecobacter sp.]
HAFIRHTPGPAGEHRLRLAVKDFIDVRGMVTSAGSRYLAKNNPPARRDAACLALARERGVRIVGKTNANEFGVTASGINPHFGTPRSPLSTKRKLITGGSSSGSAVAVATGMADVAFGTDTGGSVRIPAAFCGVYGLKTTYGLVSLKGVFPMSPKHLDTVGPLAKDVPHLVEGMSLLQRDFPERYREAQVKKPTARSIRVGRLYVDGTDPAIDRAVDEALKARGFKVVKLDDKFKKLWEDAQRDGSVIAVSDAWLNDDKYRYKRGVGSITKTSILLGEVEYRLNYQGALARREAWRRALRQVFRRVDLIAMPTMKQLPPRLPSFGGSGVFEVRVFSLQNTVAFNYSGTPAIAIPIPVEGKDVSVTSLQFAGPRLSEAELLNAARLISSKRR